MMRVDVWIQGTSALLQNRFPDPEIDGPEPAESAESALRRAHLDDDGFLCLPGASIACLLRQVAQDAGIQLANRAVVVLDENIPLYAGDHATRLEDFDIDARAVRCPHGRRVMRYRPRIDDWSAPVRLSINERLVSPSVIRDLLTEGGQSVGVGDFRPQCGGPFGTFMVTRWSDQRREALAASQLKTATREMSA